MSNEATYILTNDELSKAIGIAHWHSQHTGTATEAHKAWNKALAGLLDEQLRRARSAKEAV